MTILMVVELLVVLVALWIGARYGSLALGAISGIGLAILFFGFQLKPGTPPTDVIYIIIAAVTCAGMLQASGGMDWMIQIAEKMLRKHPDRITLLAPFTTFFLTVLVGTGHIVYTLMPIICDIALKKGIRPECPCGIASIASQIGITCSPIAAAVVAFASMSADNGFNVSNIQIIMVTIPACIIGILMAVVYSWRRRSLDAPAGLLPRHRRLGAPRRDAVRLRLFLHPELSVGHRHGELRSIGHHGHRQVAAQPLIHGTRHDPCGQRYRRGILHLLSVPHDGNVLIKNQVGGLVPPAFSKIES